MNEYLTGFVIVFSLLVNLITIIKFTAALEKRLTILEVTQERVFKPQIDDISKTITLIYDRVAHSRVGD